MRYKPASKVKRAKSEPAPAPHRVEIGVAAPETVQAATAPAAESKWLTVKPQKLAPADVLTPRAVTAASVKGADVTVHRVRLGPKVQRITVVKSAGVQVGDHNRMHNQYRFRMDRPQVSLDHLLKEHPATLRSFERLVANPRSWLANYSFRHHLPTGPAAAGRGVLFAGTSRAPAMRISTRLDEHGATVVENSRGVQVGDHNRMRNDFSYKLTGQELSLGRILHDRPDLARSLAMTVRHPGNPAVQRSFTRQISDAYTHGGAPSLRSLNQDLPGGNLSVRGSVGAQIGVGNTRTDGVSVDIRGLGLTGWESTAEQIAAKVDELASAPRAIDRPDDVVRPAAPPAARLALGIRRSEPFDRRPPDPGRSPGGGIGRL